MALAAIVTVLGAPLQAARAADSATVLMYHRFGESDFPSTNITLEQLDDHIAELRKERYSVLPLPEIVRALRDGRPLPDRAVAITVDDTFLSLHAVAWPRFRAAGLPITLFVSTDSLDQSNGGNMSWDQLREMAAAGVTVGNHGATHLHMAKSSEPRNREDIRRSNQRLEAELGTRPELFSYPYGEAGLAQEKLVQEEGFLAAFGQHSGAFDASSDMYYLPRFALNEHYGKIERLRLAINALAFPVTDLVPPDHLITGDNPPAIGFTVASSVNGLERLACFASNVTGRVQVERLGSRRIEVRMDTPMPPGRTRLNCTLPGPDGRWLWLGRQFYVPD